MLYLAVVACAGWHTAAGAQAPEPVTAPEPEADELPMLSERIEPRPCDQIYVSQHRYLDATRERLEETICTAALWLDGVAGEHGNVLAARRSRGRLDMSYYYSQFGGSEFRLRLKVRVELPVLKRRLSAFIGLDNEDDFVRGRSEGFALRSEFPSLGDDEEWLAGMGYRFPGNEIFRSEFRVGVRRFTDTQIFIQNGFRYLAYADHNDIWTLREILFWNNEDGFGSTSGVDWMHVINDRLLARWDSVGTITQETHGLNWRSAGLLYKELSSLRAIVYEIFIRGETRHIVPIREYGLRFIYRHPLFEQRVFLELINGYTWPKDDPSLERKGSYGIGVGFELPFGPDEN